MRAHAMTAARMLGLKLLMLSVSAAAVASALPEAAQQSLADASFAGMKLTHLIFGTGGAGATLWFVDRIDARILGATIFCGILCAVGGTPLLAHAYANWFAAVPRGALPGPVENALAIALGAGGMYIIPGLQRLFRKFGDDPLAFIERLRRGGPPPGGGGQP